jgi:hypothetical protein
MGTVSYNKINKKFDVRIGTNNKNIYLGSYITEEQAAEAYNKKAIELFGEYAKLNIIITNSNQIYI